MEDQFSLREIQKGVDWLLHIRQRRKCEEFISVYEKKERNREERGRGELARRQMAGWIPGKTKGWWGTSHEGKQKCVIFIHRLFVYIWPLLMTLKSSVKSTSHLGITWVSWWREEELYVQMCVNQFRWAFFWNDISEGKELRYKIDPGDRGEEECKALNDIWVIHDSMN